MQSVREALVVLAAQLAARDAGAKVGDTAVGEREANLIMAAVLGCEPKDLVFKLDQALDADQHQHMTAMAARRLEGRPIGQALGFRAFWNHDFLMDHTVLEPRPDTETLVESVLNQRENGPMRLLDLGVGSGAILLSLLAERPRWRGVGVDLMPGPIKVTQANADRLKLEDRVKLYQGEWLAPLEGCEVAFDIIVSNPPYIASDVIEDLDPTVRDFEPREALDGGGDGLSAYRAILRTAARWLKPGGLLAFEIGYDQGKSVSALFDQDFQAVSLLQDLAGHDRVVSAIRS